MRAEVAAVLIVIVSSMSMPTVQADPLPEQAQVVYTPITPHEPDPGTIDLCAGDVAWGTVDASWTVEFQEGGMSLDEIRGDVHVEASDGLRAFAEPDGFRFEPTPVDNDEITVDHAVHIAVADGASARCPTGTVNVTFATEGDGTIAPSSAWVHVDVSPRDETADGNGSDAGPASDDRAEPALATPGPSIALIATVPVLASVLLRRR